MKARIAIVMLLAISVLLVGLSPAAAQRGVHHPPTPSRENITAALPPGTHLPRALIANMQSSNESPWRAHALATNGVDPYEPNDTPGEATPISYGDELDGAIIQVEGDTDWYAFEASANDQIDVYVDARGIGSSLDSYLTLYQTVNDEIVEMTSNDGYYHPDSHISWYLENDGTHYLQVRESDDPNQGGEDYFYSLLLYLHEPWQSAEFEAIEDAYVNQGAKTVNYGSATILRVKNAAADMNAYLKFWVDLDLSAGQCIRDSNTYLRGFVKEPSVHGGYVYRVDNGWNENSITWNNASPIIGGHIGDFSDVYDEEDNWAWLVNYPISDGWHSFAIHNNSTNSVDFSSVEGEAPPALEAYYQIEPTRRPHASYHNDIVGLVPLTVKLEPSNERGCPTSWLWDFGDGTTSTERTPTHVYTDPGIYYLELTVSNSEGSYSQGWWAAAVEPPSLFYISPATNATIGGIAAQAADVLLYDKAADEWSMVYDGSDHGTTKNVSAFTFEDDGSLLLTFSANQSVPGLGTATPRDVVRFTPNVPWSFPIGSGSWSWYLRGNWPGVGLTTSSEALDAIDQSWDILSLSTIGAASLPTTPSMKIADEDIAMWESYIPAWYNWLVLDGSSIVGLASEDVNGYWEDTYTNEYYFTILGSFNLGGVTGDGKSIVRLEWVWDRGWQPSLVQWLAPGATFPSTIDAIELAR